MTFGPDDEDEYFVARQSLLERFEAWPLRSAGNAGDAEVLLDWKFRYADGDLVTWTTADVKEFLLEWMPAKAIMPSAAAAPFVTSIREFVAFLTAERVLGLGSSSSRALDAEFAKIAPRMATALGDPSHYGMGKSMLGSFDAAGPWADLDDEEDEHDDEFDLPMPPALDAARPDVLAEIEGHSLTSDIELLRAFVGDGRKVTSAGNLKVADATALAEQMGVDAWSRSADASEPVAVKSAADLAELQFRMELAEAVGAIVVERTRVSAADAWAELPRAEAVTGVIQTLLEEGPLTLATPEGAWVNHDIYGLLEDSLPQLVALLWALGEDTAPFDGLVAATVEACLEELDYDVASPALASAPAQAEATFTRLCDVLEIAGVVSRTGERYEPRTAGGTKRVGGELALTNLARTVLAEYLSDNGFVIPVVGEFAADPLAALISAADDWHADRLAAEFEQWVISNGSAAAAEQLVDLAAATRFAHERLLVGHLAMCLTPADVEPVMRLMLDTPVRGHATMWLLEHDCEVEIDPEAMMGAGVDLFACQIDDVEEFIDALEPIDDLRAFIDEIWRLTDVAAGEVLETIGKHHPDKAIAKHARKALIRHRSHVANLNQ